MPFSLDGVSVLPTISECGQLEPPVSTTTLKKENIAPDAKRDDCFFRSATFCNARNSMDRRQLYSTLYPSPLPQRKTSKSGASKENREKEFRNLKNYYYIALVR